MAILEELTPHELRDLPTMPDQLLAEKGLVRQIISLMCVDCDDFMPKPTVPTYEGDLMYSLSCNMCGTNYFNVDADGLFVELDDWSEV